MNYYLNVSLAGSSTKNDRCQDVTDSINDCFPKWLFFRKKNKNSIFFCKKSVFFKTWIAVNWFKINGFEKMKVHFTWETLAMPTWQTNQLKINSK